MKLLDSSGLLSVFPVSMLASKRWDLTTQCGMLCLPRDILRMQDSWKNTNFISISILLHNNKKQRIKDLRENDNDNESAELKLVARWFKAAAFHEGSEMASCPSQNFAGNQHTTRVASDTNAWLHPRNTALRVPGTWKRITTIYGLSDHFYHRKTNVLRRHIYHFQGAFTMFFLPPNVPKRYIYHSKYFRENDGTNDKISSFFD